MARTSHVARTLISCFVVSLLAACASPGDTGASASASASADDGAAAASASSSMVTNATGASLDAALSGAWRTPQNVARDKYRHPKETLSFFMVNADDTVIEITPGGGWYTEVLAPYPVSYTHLTLPTKA